MRNRTSISLGLLGAILVASVFAMTWTATGASRESVPQSMPQPPSLNATHTVSVTDYADAEAVPGELIVGFASSAAGGAGREIVIAKAGARLERHLLLPDYSLVSVPPGDEAEYAERLLSEPGVVSVEPNLIQRASFDPNDEFYSFQWHFPKIGLPAAWDKTMGNGVTVAVIDSGIAYENCSSAVCGQQFFKAPDFGGTVFVSPRDMINGDSHANDEAGHGTHVASTIAEATNNTIGGAGVAPDASIMPVKVLDADGIGPIADGIDGIIWAADHGADVLNLSLGHSGTSVAEQTAINYAIQQGAVVVAAAGNGGEDGIGDPEILCPACYPGVVAVGATRLDQTLAPYSNYGSSPPGVNHAIVLVAPGGDNTEDWNLDGFADGVLQQTFQHACSGPPIDYSDFTYCFFDGTSMASPHVAGVAALVLSVNPGLTPAGVYDILTTTATDLGTGGYDSVFGFGEINAAAAVAAAQSSPTPGQGCPAAAVSGSTFADALSSPLSIPDSSSSGITNCFTISDSRTINDINVGLAIRHTWVGDLIVRVTHVDTGTTVGLIDRPGSGTLGCLEDDISATFSDEAGVPAQDKCNGGGGPAMSGGLRPVQSLSAFDGESVGGTWRLFVSDNAAIDTGTLDAWSLTATLKSGSTPPTPTSVLPTPQPTPTPTSPPPIPTATPTSPLPTATPTSPPPTVTPTSPPPTATPVPPSLLLGDPSCNGVVNAIDALFILQFLAGLTGLCSEANADVNQDLLVNAIDATLLLQFLAGLIGTLPP